MSAQRKKTTAKKGEPRTERAKLLDYDPTTLTGADTLGLVTFARVNVTDEDGQPQTVLVDARDGLTEEESVRSAVAYARAIRRVEDAWTDKPTSEEVQRDATAIASAAADIVFLNILRVGDERFGDELTTALGDHWDEKPGKERLRQIFLDTLDEAYSAELVADTRKQATAAILLDFEEEAGDELQDLTEAEWDARFSAYFLDRIQAQWVNGALKASQDIAARMLEVLKPTEKTLDGLVGLLKPPGDDRILLSTAPIDREIQKSLTRATLRPHDAIIRERVDGVRHNLKVRTSVSFDTIFSYDRQEDVLDRIQKSLLEVKKYGAALLKLHLDLTSAAYTTGGQLPAFRYGFAEALERQGYAKSDARRGFHNETMRGFRERIAALQLHTVQAWTEKRGTKEYLTKTPYWIVEAYHYSKQEALDLDIVPVLMRTGETTAYTAVTIRPGLWWATTEMHRYRIEVPRNILALPTDGSGNERERMALLLATFLAVHVRRNQKHSAGRSVRVRAGTLLQEAGIVDEQTFMHEHGTAAARRRDYLHDLDDQGALPILRNLGAFDVTIRDEADFFATGRGWKERFWSAMLDVQVPDLGVTKKALTT